MSIVHSGLEGLVQAQAALEKSAGRIAARSLPLSGLSGDVVDISAEAVALMSARNAYRANLTLVSAGDEMQQSLLDLMA